MLHVLRKQVRLKEMFEAAFVSAVSGSNCQPTDQRPQRKPKHTQLVPRYDVDWQIVDVAIVLHY